MVVQVHQRSRAEQGAMERADDLSLSVTVEDDLVIAQQPEDPTRDYAVEVRILLHTLADAMSDDAVDAKARVLSDPRWHDAAREKAWGLAEFMVGTVTLSRPDWLAIELCASELAHLAGELRASGP
jgi:hypothetical protein